MRSIEHDKANKRLLKNQHLIVPGVILIQLMFVALGAAVADLPGMFIGYLAASALCLVYVPNRVRSKR